MLVVDDNVGFGGTLGPVAADYKRYDQRTHVYMKPDTYIGADTPMVRDEWLFDPQTGKMFNVSIDFVPGCERIFIEILSNASDNVGLSRRLGVDPGSIDILMDNNTISITNYGVPMPIEINEAENMYVPQLSFGYLLTSRHYETKRHEAGTNGIGSKATNIFSSEFCVIIHDHIRHKKYTQVWNTNMINRSEPLIQAYNGKSSSLQVIYKMDFAKFGYPLPNGTTGGYPAEAFGLFARHAVDTSFTAKIPVSFNGVNFNFSNIRDYAKLYFGDAVDTGIVHYQWPIGTEVINKKKGYQISKTPGVMPVIELIAIDTPDDGHHLSFVNCMMTRDGGVHVNAAFKSISDGAVQMINQNSLKRLSKLNKGKELNAKDKRAHTITMTDVKPHISILLSVRVEDPKFTSQSKTCLHSPTPKITVSDDELKSIGKWQLIERLYAALEAKQFNSLATKDGKLKRQAKLMKGIDANQSFSKKSDERHKCGLYITEGNSGAGYANTLTTLIPGGRDYIGVLPMRGKSLNVMNADRFQIEKNIEINELKKMIGLVEGMDYSLDINFNKLRYGYIMIMADSDVDGKHITGLLINYFHCRFPTLLERNFIRNYLTPIITITRGKEIIKFYTEQTYIQWKNMTPDYDKWEHKYYKGLGSSEKHEVEYDIKNPHIVNCFYDIDAPNAIELAFAKRYADSRKDWISRFIPLEIEQQFINQPISWFINNELILFSLADVARSIPRIEDGLKESQRKIIYGAHLHWKIGSKKGYARYKVAQFGSYVAEKTSYHHGEIILGDVIVGMAQDFLTSNNITYFTPEGRFGSHYENGKDASQTRYLHTRPMPLLKYVYDKRDKPILRYLQDEGKTIEPDTYYPIIPMVLVNGTSGIGTGWSTFIACHNPLDIINWIKLKISGVPDEKLPEVLPWYRGYQGEIKVIDRRNKKKEREDN